MADQQLVARAVVVPLEPSPSEERLLVSYCGARRFAYNRGIGLVKENLDARKPERAAGLAEADLTPAVSWSYRSLDMRWHEVRDVVALPRQNHTAPVRRSSQGQRMWTGHRQR